MRPSPKRKLGGSPGSGICSSTAQRVPVNGLGGGSFGIAEQPASATAAMSRLVLVMQGPFGSFCHQEVDGGGDQVDARAEPGGGGPGKTLPAPFGGREAACDTLP